VKKAAADAFRGAAEMTFGGVLCMADRDSGKALPMNLRYP
jgi:hypothetical protein